MLLGIIRVICCCSREHFDYYCYLEEVLLGCYLGEVVVQWRQMKARVQELEQAIRFINGIRDLDLL